ncbi:MAG: glycerol kinase, partial [Candidatus Omnitrophica bacterium]|nr:glycerol kinase [Candidatus Omnitrophota bacterium]
MVEYILSIDQGTTGSKVVVYDKRGVNVASAYQEIPQYFPKPGWVEHDPEEIWESVNSSIQKVLKKVSAEAIKAIGITNQRETTVIWDAETGRPICNAIVWQCRRTSGMCDQLKKKKGEVAFFKKKTGLPIDAYFSATKIAWILKNIPGAARKARKGKLRFGTTDTWILWKLTGGKSHATDYTNASRTMLFNIDTLKWDKAILKKFSIPEEILPEVKASSSIFGKTVKTGKLSAGVFISGIAGDQQAALFGQGCFTRGGMKNTYGTGCFVLMNAGKKRPDSKHGLIVTLGCGHKGEPVYVLEGS